MRETVKTGFMQLPGGSVINKAEIISLDKFDQDWWPKRLNIPFDYRVNIEMRGSRRINIPYGADAKARDAAYEQLSSELLRKECECR